MDFKKKVCNYYMKSIMMKYILLNQCYSSRIIPMAEFTWTGKYFVHFLPGFEKVWMKFNNFDSFSGNEISLIFFRFIQNYGIFVKVWANWNNYKFWNSAFEEKLHLCDCEYRRLLWQKLRWFSNILLTKWFKICLP